MTKILLLAVLLAVLLGACGRNDPRRACGGRRAETIGGVVVIGCR